MQIAEQTKALVDAALERDGGRNFRVEMKKAMGELTDAFSPEIDTHPRTHLGASLIGRRCSRFLWMSFRWCFWQKPEAKMIRLFNRGHLEEARSVALLRQAGITLWPHNPETGKQFKISGAWGYFGGSLDGIAVGAPEFQAHFLTEFKTHGAASFSKLVKQGVARVKSEHVVQMQMYSVEYQLIGGLYVATCKDNDEIHYEVIPSDASIHAQYKERAEKIVQAQEPPPRISASPTDFECKYCPGYGSCHYGMEMLKTCRTCARVQMIGDGKWKCTLSGKELTSDEQFAACQQFIRISSCGN